MVEEKEVKKILAIFPHPDDEIMTVAGYFLGLSDKEKVIAIMTKGERGTQDGSMDESLGKIREKEMRESANILGSKLLQYDFEDGRLGNMKRQVFEKVWEMIESVKPDLVITYDKSGLYGHPDHVVLSETITDIWKEKRNFRLWYAVQPDWMYRFWKLPTHMALDENFVKDRCVYDRKFLVWKNVIRKIRALYSHKSQIGSFGRSMPISWIPIWFYLLFLLFEYFCEVE